MVPETAAATAAETGVRQLKFRDPARARALGERLSRLVAEILARRGGDRRGGARPVTLMHVCGSHEQAIARYGLRSAFPRGLEVIMGPGCPVCVTDAPEVDEAVLLADQGAVIATYGDMLRVPGTVRSLADAMAGGARVQVVYSVAQAVELARRQPEDQIVFFASGFETTAVTTAAAIVAEDLPPNFSVLSAHKYIPPAMELVAALPVTRIEGYLAAGHAATITGWGVFEPFAERYRVPVVVAGFEPLDILAGLVQLVERVRDRRPGVANAYPRCVTREGNLRAQEQLWRVFRTAGGRWRGIAEIPDGNLRLREEWAAVDARRRFDIDLSQLVPGTPRELAEACLCGDIMTGLAAPTDCRLFGEECRPETPIGACMVSSEGTCKIWHQYGGRPDLTVAAPTAAAREVA